MSFDAQALLNATTAEANSTKLLPAPVGDYVGQVSKVDVKSGVSKSTGEVWCRLELTLESEDPKLDQIGMKKKNFRADALLELTPMGTIDTGPGKNVALGRMREAAGLNQPGQPFSLGMFQGQVFKFTIEHQPDQTDPEKIYERVKALRSPAA